MPWAFNVQISFMIRACVHKHAQQLNAPQSMYQAAPTAGQVVMIPPQSGQQAQQAVTTLPNWYMALALTTTIVCGLFNLPSLLCGIPAIVFASMVSIT